MADYQNYGRIEGPIVIIGFGSIGRGTIPLIERHFDFNMRRMIVIDPNIEDPSSLSSRGIQVIEEKVTPDNYEELLGRLLTPGQGFCVNLSVDTGSLDIMKFCRERKILYIDTVVEPWAGFYFDDKANSQRTNYALRQAVRDEKVSNPGGSTAVSCCGANPGMVNWFVKEALLTLARDTGHSLNEPQSREDWAALMRDLGVKGIHIAERDTQKSINHKTRGTFVNTWSVEGFISEGFQPAELGWGTHETWMPEDSLRHDSGCQAGIWIERPGAVTRVHTWCPTPGPQYGFLVTHNEAISISDYYTIGDGADPEYRPTCHYAYLEALKSAMPGVMSAAGFGRKVGLRDKGYFLALVDEGHTPATRIKQPTTGRDQLRVTEADIAEFHRRFLTPTTITAEFGLHRNTIFAAFRETGVVPFAPDGRDFGSLYLRSEAAPLFARA